MAIPDYQACMLAAPQKIADGKEHKLSEQIDELGSEFGLTDEELSKLLPSGTQKVFTNRVGWARTYLKKAGLLDSPGARISPDNGARSEYSFARARAHRHEAPRTVPGICSIQSRACRWSSRTRAGWCQGLFRRPARPLRSWRMHTVKFDLRWPMKFSYRWAY